MAKSSSSLNSSLLHSYFFPLEQHFFCHISGASSFILTAYFITNIALLLPLCIFIFSSGIHQFHSKRTTARRAMRLSDCFTYHLMIMELINVVNSMCRFSAVYRKDSQVIFVGHFFVSLIWHGQTFFHMLTCVEHYLAVVYPIFYLSLEDARGVKLRNISICCVWLISFVGMGLTKFQKILALLDICILVFSLAVMSFCSLSILFNLQQPFLGEKEVGKKRVSQAKQRAFKTVLSILVLQVLRFFGSIIWTIVDIVNTEFYCIIMAFSVLISLPSSLVIPLLFLHRKGKCVRCKKI